MIYGQIYLSGAYVGRIFQLKNVKVLIINKKKKNFKKN